MRINIYPEVLKALLNYFENDEKFIECGFDFQISGTDDGEEFMRNGHASFQKDSHGNIIVIYNGTQYENLHCWLDGLDYDESEIDAITINHLIN